MDTVTALQILVDLEGMANRVYSASEISELWSKVERALDVIRAEILRLSKRGDYDGGLRSWMENKHWTANETIATLVEDWDNW